MTESAPKFSDFELAPELRRALEEQGYDTPTPIQAEAIPALLEGRDVLGQAQTGTGKTAAFALPMLQRLDPHQTSVQAIVLAPTRELALQVNEAVRTYGKFLGKNGVRSLAVYGGQPIHIQLKHLSRGVQVVIGTPGRVKDHLERKTLDLSGVRFFGLDEADEMLKMGFIEDVEWILEQAPPERQIALFSATLPGPIKRVAERYLKNFVDVHVAAEARSIDTIEQFCMRVSGRRKLEALERVLEAEDYEAVLVFCRTQRNCAELTEQLQASGYQADCVHGGMSQAQREQVVGRLRRRALQIVVATDVAARGLDIDHISLVINYDLPRDAEVYVHRIGRTGRAGRTGRSIAFWLPRERRLLKGFEHYAGQPMTLMPVPTSADIEGQRRRRFAAEVRRLSAEDLPEFTALVHKLCGEEGLDVVRVAAAGLKLAWGDHPLTPTASIRSTPRPEIAFAPAAPAGATP
ncbi:MAG: DEAD/DEAH box helicase, partial [Planctomycetes bacterium]|nr:DEAD/DEAH box helicase [Planctomycetota bacterium]